MTLIGYIQNYQRKWKEHMNKMNAGRVLKQILHHHSRGQRSIGCPMEGKYETITDHLAQYLTLRRRRRRGSSVL
jgi:hypothetical protein